MVCSVPPSRASLIVDSTTGDIIGLRIFGQTIIVLNSVKDVRELFQNRASNYSSRVSLTMVQL